MRHLHPLILYPVILLVPVIGWVVFWFFAVKGVQMELDAWAAAQRKQDYQITYGVPQVTGFPLSVDLLLDNVRLVAPQSVGGWIFSTPQLRLKAAPYDFGSLQFLPAAPAVLIPPATSGLPPMTLTSGQARVSLSLTVEGRVAEAGFDLSGAVIDGLLAEGPLTVERLVATSQRPNVPEPADAKTVTNEIAIEGAGIVPPPGTVATLGPRIEKVSLQAQVLGTIGPERLVFALRKWRDGGGSINVPNVRVEWPPATLQASGAFALDAEMQPAGSLSATIQGFMEAIDAMQKSGAIRSKDASMARIVLGALSTPDPQGGKPFISLPFSLQGRKLLAGPVPMWEVPPIVWGDAEMPGDPLTPGLGINPDGTLQPGMEIKPSGEVIHID